MYIEREITFFAFIFSFNTPKSWQPLDENYFVYMHTRIDQPLIQNDYLPSVENIYIYTYTFLYVRTYL